MCGTKIPATDRSDRGAAAAAPEQPVDQHVTLLSDPSVQRLGDVGGVLLALSVGAAPWELPIDTLVISVGRGGVGELGASVRRALPNAGWTSIDMTAVRPEHPAVMAVSPEQTAVRATSLRRLVLASVRPDDRRASPWNEPPATLDAVRKATEAAIKQAMKAGASTVGLPLLGAGAVGFPSNEVASEMVPAVRQMLATKASDGAEVPTAVVFVCRDEVARAVIHRVWSYEEMLPVARLEALDDPVIQAEALKVGLSVAELARSLDVPEGRLWEPCAAERAEVRHLDTALEHVTRDVLEARRLTDRPGVGGGTRKRSSTTKGRDATRGEAELSELLVNEPRWRGLSAERDQALGRLRMALLEESLLPRLRQAINEHARASRDASREGRRSEFTTPLRHVVDTGGLRGRPRPGGLLRTTAQADLDHLVDVASLPRASVGVAGPRGCGKSTLLEHYVETWGAGVAVLVPAPATYAPRDFLTYLYGIVCEKVLERDPQYRGGTSEERTPVARLRAVSVLSLGVAPALVGAAGAASLAGSEVWRSGSPSGLRSAGMAVVVVAVVVGLVLAASAAGMLRLASSTRHVALSGEPRQLSLSLPGPARALATTAIAGSVVVLASLGVLSARQAAGGVLALVAAGTFVLLPAVRWRSVSTGDSLAGAPRPAGPSAAPVDPGMATLLTMGRRGTLHVGLAAAQLTAIVTGTALAATPATALPVDASLLVGAALSSAGLSGMLFGRRMHALVERDVSSRLAVPADVHSARARDDLRKILYQRSVSSGWTSSVKFAASPWVPFGLDAGASGATTEADVPLSVPDLVAGIRYLLPSRGPALVAIDELDKIEADEAARAFLNEIKGILDAPDTRFLVSMSEDAIAQFERRGLPFRDVFDSAFDEVVRVPYLSAAEAHTLLSQRVTGLPEPFVALAFCLSGGLPRDLLRATARLVAMAPTPGDEATLRRVVDALVHADSIAKVDAVTAAIKGLTVEPDVSTFIRCVQTLDTCANGVRGASCLINDGWLVEAGALPPIVPSSQAADLPERRKLLRLAAELIGYLYYCRTLLEIFAAESPGDVDRLTDFVDEDDGARLDALARARQNFAVNPFVAWAQLDDVRRAMGLSTHPLPRPFMVAGAEARTRVVGGPLGARPMSARRVARRGGLQRPR